MKKLFLITVTLLILLFTVSVATANDLDEFAVQNSFGGGGNNPTISHSDTPTTISSSSNQIDILSDSGSNSKTWADIKSAIENAQDGDTIYLNGSTVTASTSSIITVSKSITINGGSKDDPSSRTTLDGKNITRIMSTSVNVVLINIIFLNGCTNVTSGNAQSGAIYNTGNNLTLINCSFINNSAISKAYSYGGAIWSSGGLNIINCTFINNSAFAYFTTTNTISLSAYGGAIYSSGILNIFNSSFINNSAIGRYYSSFSSSPSTSSYSYAYGGAVYSTKTFTISNSSFISNFAIGLGNSSNHYGQGRAYGGAIYSQGLTIINCKFINNQVQGIGITASSSSSNSYPFTYACGGAIYSSSILNIFNSSFINNSALGICKSPSVSSSASVYGGAIYCSAINIFINSSRFINNSISANSKSSTSVYGGALYLYSDYIILINTSYFINNNASYNGTNSNPSIYGGAIYSQSSLFADNCVFTNNSASPSFNGKGGSIYITNSIIYNSNFTGGVAQSGKEIYIIKKVYSNNSLFNGSKDFSNFIFGNMVVKVLPEFDTNLTNRIKSASAGDVIFLNNTSYYLSGPISINKNLTIYGGFNENDNKTSILTTYGLLNMFSISGSKIHVRFINVLFVEGYSRSNGGSITISTSSSKFDFINCSFINSSCYNSRSGGAIYISDNKANVNFINCSFINNSAVGSSSIYGGAIYTNANNTFFLNCSFINNYINLTGSSDADGGAIYNTGVLLNIFGCCFINNFIYRNYFISSSSSSSSSSYYKSYGGAIYNSGSLLNISNSSFINNFIYHNLSGSSSKYGSTLQGGAIFATSVSITNSNFTNNYLELKRSQYYSSNPVYGGAIYASNLNISNCNFIKNNVSSTNANTAGDGGAIRVGNYINANNSTFSYNSAFDWGGAICLVSSSKYTSAFVNCIFNNNSANYYGGAVYATNGYILTFTMCNFTNNSLTYTNNMYGGAIYSTFISLELYDCNFYNNFLKYTSTSKYNFMGGAVYHSSTNSLNFIAYNTNFTGNHIVAPKTSSSFLYGAAVYVASFTSVFSNCTFKDNFLNSKNSNSSGAAICGVRATDRINVYNSVFINNSINNTDSKSYGGAIYSNGTLDVYGSKFVNNKAYNGGSIYLSFGYISNSNFTNGSEKPNKGIYIKNNATIINSTFNNTQNPTKYVHGKYTNGTIKTGNFSYQIQNQINNGNNEIFLKNLTYNSISTVFINNNLTIYGGDSATDHKMSTIIGNYVPIFDSFKNCCIKLVNIAFTNCYSNFGGVLIGRGKVILINCSFSNTKNNITGNSYGGFINVIGILSIIGCNFSNNSFSLSGKSIYLYGLMNVVGSFSAIDCKFSNNSFFSTSNAYTTYNYIYGLMNVVGSFSAIDCDFSNNSFYSSTSSFGVYGIVGYVSNSLANGFFVDGINFSNNVFHVNSSYAAFYLDEQSSTNKDLFAGNIVNSNFTNNIIDVGRSNSAYIIYSTHGLNVSNCIFSNNSFDTLSTSNLNFYSLYMRCYNKIVIADCLFLNQSNASGIFVYTYNMDMVIKNCNFTNVGGYYGGIRVYSSTSSSQSCKATISDCNFINTSATNGGVFYLSGDTNDVFSINNCNYINNSATLGSLFYIAGVTITISYHNFTNINNGNLFYLTSGKLTINYSNFTNISFNTTNGLICATGSSSNIVLQYCIFKDLNKTPLISLKNSAKATISYCQFINNTCNNSDYGGLISKDSSSSITTSSSKFLNNNVSWSFDDIRNMINYYVVDNSVFLGNQTYSNNGVQVNSNKNNAAISISKAVTIYGGWTTNDGKRSTIDASSAVNILTIGRYAVTFVNINFVNGKSTGNGGVLSYSYDTLLTFINCSFINNSATNYGGALYIASTSSYGGNLKLVNCSFINNSAKEGGAIYSTSSYNYIPTISVDSCVFSNNSATKGVAIMSSSSSLDIKNSSFNNNVTVSGAQLNIGSKTYLTLNNNSFNGSIPIYVSSDTIINSPTFVFGNITGDYKSNISVSIRFTDDNNNTIGSFDNLTVKFDNSFVTLAFNNKTGNHTGKYYATDRNVSNFMYNNFLNLNVKINFTIFKINSSFVIIGVENFTYGNSISISISDAGDLSGFITISYGEFSKNITLSYKDSYTEKISSLDVGKYNITIFYSGDVNYLNRTVSMNFTVNQANSSVFAFTFDGFYGDSIDLSIILSSDATGNVTINEKDFINQTVVITNHEFIYNLGYMNVGTHTINVTYNGDNNYKSNSYSVTFTIFKAIPNITIDGILNMVYGESSTVSFTSSSYNITGNLTVSYGNVKHNISINDKEVISNLIAGSYSFKVAYAGDSNYHSFVFEKGFNVTKADSNLNIQLNNYVYGEEKQLIITIDGSASGTINLEYAGGNHTIQIAEGTLTYAIGDLNAGSYDITATYSGDSNYKNTTFKTTFTVNKADVTISINEINDLNYGDIGRVSFEVNPISNGNLNIEYFDRTSTISINGQNKKAVLIGQLNVGEYNFTVSYEGDENYNSASAYKTFKVIAILDEISVTITSNFTYGGYTTAIITLDKSATGNISISYGEIKDTIQISNSFDGVIKYDIRGLNASDYEFLVQYNGDVNHKTSQDTTKFKVFKAEITMDVHISNYTFGNTTSIIVSFANKSAEGSFTVDYAGNTIETEITHGGSYVFLVSDLDAATYKVKVTYSGDNNYLTKDINCSFTVNKTNPMINANIGSFVAGQPVVVNVEVPNHASGNIELNITDTSIKENIDSSIVKFILPCLKLGNYEIKLTYSGDNNYNNCTVSIPLMINKIDTEMNVSISKKVISNGDILINVYLPHDASGNVTVKVDSNIHIKNITNGQVTFIISKLGEGNHTINVKYLGDDYYGCASYNDTIEVLKENPLVVSSECDDVGRVISPFNHLAEISENRQVILDNNIFNKSVLAGVMV